MTRASRTCRFNSVKNEPVFIHIDPSHFIADSGSGIIDKLLSLHATKPFRSAQLLNYYKEVPISGAAHDIRFEDNRIFCRTNDIQSRVISLTRETILNFTSLPHYIHATADYCAESREVALSGFSLVDVLSHHRGSIRVRMHVPHSVVIESGHNKINGRLHDISLAGCAINIADSEQLDKSYVQIQINVPLKTGLAPVQVRVAAKLIRTVKDNNICSCVFVFEHSKSSEDQIGKIVAMRQMDIIRELK